MPLKFALPHFTFHRKKDQNMSRYVVQGKGPVQLTKADFKARGGEGSIFVKNATAYKIYTDPGHVIPPAKIQELSVLDRTNIIRPLNVLLDSSDKPVGYSMRHVPDAYAVCQLFPKSFRQRTNLTTEMTMELVRKLQEGVSHIHANGILVVDLNELNLLVARDFKELFFIDVDSYQTPSYPATRLMESVRDRHANGFTIGTDWFSFAVVSFQMFVGIHPFKGTFKAMENIAEKEKRLDARMLANISVLHPGVTVPASCLPFTIIPPAYHEWYKAIFEDGKRLPPPEGVRTILATATPPIQSPSGSNRFEITKLREFDSDILWHDGIITVTEESIYFNGKRYPKPPFDVRVLVTSRRGHLVTAYMDGSQVRFRDLTNDREIPSGLEGESVMISGGRLYLKHRENLFEVEFVEGSQNTLVSVKVAANVIAASTLMFEGLAIQSLLGAFYASIPNGPGACYQVRLSELDAYRIVDARLFRNVLVVIGANQGRYDRLVFRFAKDFRGYTLRTVRDVTLTGINFTVLDSGLVLNLTDEDVLEIFPCHIDSPRIETVLDPAIDGNIKLFHTGSQALIARCNKLYRIKLRRLEN